MRDAFLFSDTVPPTVLKEAFRASGFRLRGFQLVRQSNLPPTKIKGIMATIYLALIYYIQKIRSYTHPYKACELFFYTNRKTNEGFLQFILAIKKTFNLSRPPTHVSDLSKKYFFRRKRFFAVGAPGSGNMIFLRISDEILKMKTSHKNFFEDDPIGDFLKNQALLYMSYFTSRLQESLKPHYISDALGPEGFGRCYFSGNIRRSKISESKFTVEDGGIFVTALPLNHQAWANPLHTCHQKLLSSDLGMFQKNNTDVIHVIRHPLDNLLSITSKIAFSLSLSGNEQIREKWIKRLLNTDAWFTSLLDAICKYYDNARNKFNLVNFIKYEDLFFNPKNTIKKMASFLQAPIEDSKALEMWSSLANERLTAHVGHRWKPGCGKWKLYVPRKYQGILSRSNLRDICRAFGYESPNFSQLPLSKGVPIPKISSEKLALKDLHYYFLIGKQPYFKHPNIKLVKDPLTGIEIGGFHTQVQAVRKLISSRSLF